MLRTRWLNYIKIGKSENPEDGILLKTIQDFLFFIFNNPGSAQQFLKNITQIVSKTNLPFLHFFNP